MCTVPYPKQLYQINNNMASVFGTHLDSRMKLEFQVNVLIYGFVTWKLAQLMHINMIIQLHDLQKVQPSKASRLHTNTKINVFTRPGSFVLVYIP